MKNFFITLCNVLLAAYLYLLLVAGIVASVRWALDVLLGV